MGTSRTKLGAMLAGIGLFGVAELLVAPLMSPVHDGTSAGFWWRACGVKLASVEASELGGFHPPRDGWFIYYDAGIHDDKLHRVRATVALRDFPEVVRRLELLAGDNPERPGAIGFQAWMNGPPAARDAYHLLACIRQAWLDKHRQTGADSYEYALQEERLFDQRWSRFRRYWLTQFLEFTYLSGLAFFIAYPWIRRGGRWACSAHLGLAPVLFFLPYFLGYARLTFTSRGPSGGVIYPWLIVWFRRLNGAWGDLDARLLDALPAALEPLEQPNGPWMALTGMGYVGPLTTVTLGLALATATFVLATLIGRMRQRRQRCASSASPD